MLDNPALYDVQIVYTQINRDAQNRPSFKTYRYQVDKDRYFYPASTVKLPAVLLALEKLNGLGLTPRCHHDYRFGLLPDKRGQSAIQPPRQACLRWLSMPVKY